MTLAPELPGALELGAALAARGIRVQAGHTDADYETAQRAFLLDLQVCAIPSTPAAPCATATPVWWPPLCWILT